MADKWIQLMSEDGTDNLFPVGKMDLLWTNSAPASVFASQTINIDFTDYDTILVLCRVASADGNSSWNIMKKGYDCTLVAFDYNFTPITRLSNSFNDSSITFGQGYRSGSASTDTCIPLYIYGIR